MIFRIYADDTLIYDPLLTKEGRNVLSPKLTLELNKSGSLKFVMPPDNVAYDSFTKMKTIIRVFRDDELLFRGRVLNDETDFYKRKTVYCEGDLAFLLDSQIRPYEYTGDIPPFFNKIISEHNAVVDADKRFTVGRVTVSDENQYINRSNMYYSVTSDCLNEKLLETHGGYLRTREENGVAYIDYLADYDSISTQVIRFGINLLDLTNYISAEDVFTVLVPLGGQIEDSEGNVTGRLTIESVNDGLDYIENAAGIAIFGRIEKTHEWDDVTVASNLLSKGQQYLATGVESAVKLTISAVDLNMVDIHNEAFKLGQMVRVVSDPHGLDSNFQITKIEYDIVNPDQTIYEFGADYKTLTERTAESKNQTTNLAVKLSSAIDQAIEAARNSASALINAGIGGYVLKTQDELYIMDTDDITTATKVWRWNLGGLGYWHGTAGGAIGGTYETAMTQDGAIVANFITTGTLTAGVIRAGILTSIANTDNYWNLETGELHLSSTSTTVDNNDTISSYVSSQISASASQMETRFSATFPTKDDVPVVNMLRDIYATEYTHGTTYVSNGITWTKNSDGSVTATGTASENSYYFLTGTATTNNVPTLDLDPNKKYTVSGCPAGGGSSSFRMHTRWFYANETPENANGHPVLFADTTTQTGYRWVNVGCYIIAGYSCPSGGVTFKPMVEVGTVAHPYVAANNGLLIGRLKSAESSITQNATDITLKVSATDYNGATIVNKINVGTGGAVISADRISLSGKQINLTSDNISITTNNGSFSVTRSGYLTASSGTIAGWTMSATTFYKRTSVTAGTPSTQYEARIYAPDTVVPGTNGAFSIRTRSYNGGDVSSDSSYGDWEYPFGVRYDGHLIASDADIKGHIVATSGSFSGSLQAATGTFAGALQAATGTFAGTLSAANGTFAGSLSAATGTFAGSLSAASGTFTGTLSGATGSFSGSITSSNATITGGSILLYGGTTDSMIRVISSVNSNTLVAVTPTTVTIRENGVNRVQLTFLGLHIYDADGNQTAFYH